MSEASKATFEPDYESECCNCGQTPVVVLIDGDISHDSSMCGVCFFGTADALDVDWWPVTGGGNAS